MIDKQLTERFWNLIKRIRDLLGNYHLNLRVTGLEPSYTCIEGSIQLIPLIAINLIKIFSTPFILYQWGLHVMTKNESIFLFVCKTFLNTCSPV